MRSTGDTTTGSERLALTDFLLARIAEKEAAFVVPDWFCTESARGESWGSRGECPLCGAYMFDGNEVVTEEAMYEHFEQVHQRTRVLAECEAKRLTVRFLSDLESKQMGDDLSASVAYSVLCRISTVYADHPDYRDEWRP